MDRAEVKRTAHPESLTRAAWLRGVAILGAASLTGATQRDQTAGERALAVPGEPVSGPDPTREELRRMVRRLGPGYFGAHDLRRTFGACQAGHRA